NGTSIACAHKQSAIAPVTLEVHSAELWQNTAMIYCSRCGAHLPDDANFCGSCGTALGGRLSTTAWNSAPIATPEPLDYTIVGDNLQIARVRLKDGQEVYSEAGKMVYKTGNVAWNTRMTGQTMGDKII